MPGPEASDKDVEILRRVALQPAPFVTVSDMVPDMSVGRRQTRNRLDQLVEDGLLNSRTVGTVNVYWLTDAGRQELADAGSGSAES
jgi:predicted ArsR family transcriptional regulator